MALSGSTTKKYTTKGAYWVWVEWTATQNIANNTSTITAITYGGTNGYGYTSNSNSAGITTVDGTTTTTSPAPYFNYNTAKKEINRQTKTITHNADGTKSFTLSGRWYSGSTFDLTSSGTFTLNTIPRASSLNSFPNFNIGSGVTVGITRATTFTHTVALKVGSTTIATKTGVATSAAFSAADVASIYNLASSSSSTTATVYVTTYNGSTQIGSTVSANATAYVENTIVPSLTSVSAAETISALVGVIPAGSYLQNYSRVKFTINGATAGRGASIASYRVAFNGSNYTSQVSTTGTINATGAITATATVTDTRGRTSTAKTVSCTFIGFPASLSAPNFTIGSGFTATLNRPHTNTTNQFVLKYGTTTIKDTGKISANAYAFTAADLDAIYAKIPNAVSGTVSLAAYTYAGTTAINTKTSTLTASVGSNIIPTFTSVTAAETNTAVSALSMGANQFAQSLSRIKFTVNGETNAKSSPIASFNINFNGINYGQYGTTGAISTTGDIVATATVKDTRGRTSAAKTITVKLHAYKPPAATFNAVRDEVSTETVKTTGSSSISSLNAKNRLTYKVDYKLKTASTWTNKTPATALTIGTLTFNPVFTYIGNTTTLSYDYRLTISDRVGGSIALIASVGTEAVAMSWSKTGIGAGKVWEQGALDVGTEGIYIDGVELFKLIYPVGAVYIATVATSPTTLFGGTWVQMENQFLLGAGSSYTAGATGGAATHTLTTAQFPSHTHSINHDHASATTSSTGTAHTHSVSGTTGSGGVAHTHSIPALSGTAASAGSHSHSTRYKGFSLTATSTGWMVLRRNETGDNYDGTDSDGAIAGGAHTHSVSTNANTTGGASAYSHTHTFSATSGAMSANGTHTHTLDLPAFSGTSGAAGSGTAHNNMPPYMVVYMWKRTA